MIRLLLGGVFPVGSEMLLPSAPKISVKLLAQTEDSLGPLAASKFGAGPRISRAQEPAGTSNSPKFLEQSRSERAAPQWTRGFADPSRLGPGLRAPGPRKLWGRRAAPFEVEKWHAVRSCRFSPQAKSGSEIKLRGRCGGSAAPRGGTQKCKR